MIVVAVAVVMWESPQGFPRGVGRVERRLYGFPCFPYTVISMACFLAESRFSDFIELNERCHLVPLGSHRYNCFPWVVCSSMTSSWGLSEWFDESRVEKMHLGGA